MRRTEGDVTSTSRAGGLPRGDPRPKKRPPISRSSQASVGGAFVIVGFIALILGVVGYLLNHYTDGWVPDDPLPLVLGIILIAVGVMSILLWEFLKNRVLS